jgi:hypothetical protein
MRRCCAAGGRISDLEELHQAVALRRHRAGADCRSARNLRNSHAPTSRARNGVVGDFAYRQQVAYPEVINTREHADHSVPYVVARALLDGAVEVNDFGENASKTRARLHS